MFVIVNEIWLFTIFGELLNVEWKSKVENLVDKLKENKQWI